MTNALGAYGTLIKIGDGGGGGEVFTTIAEVNSIKGPGQELETIDSTSHSSPGAFREYIAGLLDAGEISLELNYIPTSATHHWTTGVVADQINRTKRNFQLVWPDATNTTLTIACFVTKFDPEAEVDGKLGAKIDLKITGQPTWTA